MDLIESLGLLPYIEFVSGVSDERQNGWQPVVHQRH